LLPAARKPHRGDDQSYVGVGLRKVAPGLAVVEREVLREQAEVVAAPEQALEHRPRLLLAADRGERADVPEGADGEAGLGLAEVVRCNVAEQRVAAAPFAPDRLDAGRSEAH